jgi:hypothetical protein
MSPRGIREVRRDALFDLAVAEPGGVTVDDICIELDITHHQANEAIRDLRRFLGDTDTINFPCEPTGKGERWVYRLVGDLDGMRVWNANRVRDAESRFRTMDGMMTSIVRSYRGQRTVESRKARVMERALQRLVEDLDTIIEDGAPPKLIP